MKRIVFIFFVLINFIVANAQVKIDGISYELNYSDYTAKVIKDYIAYSDLIEISIPETVDYESTIFKVIEISERAFASSYIEEIELPNSLITIDEEAFYDCKYLKKIIIPNSVTSIGKWAFRNCENLASAEIGASVITIGEEAFTYCENLKTLIYNAEECADVSYTHGMQAYTSYVFPSSIENVIIGDNVKIIPKYFLMTGWGNDNLQSIEIPSSVKVVGAFAFENCSGLKSVILPESITKIEAGTFEGCSELIEIAIPNSVKVIEGYAFSHCKDLKYIYLPETIEEIKREAFYYCESLTTINLPPSLLDIESSTFRNCISLANIKIPDSVKNIGAYAFSGCTLLTSIEIPEAVETIGRNAFYGCDNLSTVYYNAINCKQGEYGSYMFWENVTNVIIGDKVTSIPDYFLNSKIKSLTIPSSVKTIGTRALTQCSELETVMFNASNFEIDPGSGSPFPKSLVSMIIGDNVNDIPIKFLEGVESLQSVKIGKSIKSIGKNAFSRCINLTAITLPASLKIIGDWAFEETGLTQLIVPDFVEEIGVGAFSKCKDLKSVYLPMFLSRIKDYSFQYCHNLKYIEMPIAVETIGKYAFDSCNLTSINISQSIKFIGEGAFRSGNSMNVNITDLEGWCNIEFENGWSNPLAKAGHLVLNGSVISDLKIPESFNYIKNYTFIGCEGLNRLVIPSSVSYIGRSAFSNCKHLEEVEVPESVIYINDYAFSYCRDIKKFNCYAMNPPVCEERTFYNIGNLPTQLYVIGEVNGWNIDNGRFVLNRMKESPNIFYGTIELQPLTAFRFYEDLGDWEGISYGPQEIDDWVEFDYLGVTESKFPLVKGKGCFSFPQIKNGKYTLVVDLLDMQLTIRPGEFIPAKTDKDLKCDMTLHVPMGTKELYATAIGWEMFPVIIDDLPISSDIPNKVETIFVNDSGDDAQTPRVYTLQGTKLKISHKDDIQNLPSGLYIINGKKVMVK